MSTEQGDTLTETPEMTEALAPLRAVLQEAAAPLPVSALPPPIADYGAVRLELMGHRYREGHLSEVVIAGTPFLRLDLEGGGTEIYAPSSVYCISPATLAAPVPRAEIPSRFEPELIDDSDCYDGEDTF